MEITGFVFSAVGLVTVWSSCVQAFDIIAAGRQYGIESEVLRVKLEVERIRLLLWGESLKLSAVQSDDPAAEHRIDSRLGRSALRTTVIGLLGCIEHVFSNADELQKKYGLKPEASIDLDQAAHAMEEEDQLTSAAAGANNILGTIFKRAYKTLQTSAKNKRQSTSFGRKTMWAINDKAKFLKLVAEIKALNDCLISLFPDVASKNAETVRIDIQSSDDIRPLQILKEASAVDHEDISDAATVQLERIGATATSVGTVRKIVRTPGKSPKTKKKRSLKPRFRDNTKATPDNEDEWEDVQTIEDEGGQENEGDDELDKFARQLEKLQDLVDLKKKGMVICSMYSTQWSAHCDASVRWHGEAGVPGSDWNENGKGFVRMPHESLGNLCLWKAV
jgi:Prion-inhibition and propagation